MYMSHVALNRIVEERAACDESFRRVLERSRRPLLSHGRAMSDEELLGKIRQFGFDAQPQELLDGFANFVSAGDMSNDMLDSAGVGNSDMQVDWVWIALTCLWERWRPNLPNMEMVDDKMQAGYAAQKTGDSLQTCRLWLEAWRAILDIIDRAGIGSLDEFDERFGGTQSMFNWVQDLELELHNAGLEEPTFFRERIALCKTIIDRFADGSLPVDNFKSALAASHFELGDRQAGDHLFRAWLEESPQWGSGWIGWSDCYWLFAKSEHKDAMRAEQILQEGLASDGVEDRTHILERLQLLYEQTGREEEAESLRAEIKASGEPKIQTADRGAQDAMQVRQGADFDEDKPALQQLRDLASPVGSGWLAGGGTSEERQRVGRNDPCPCGSGKKFKKCCARKPG